LNFPLYIAKRYLFSRSSNNTINIITAIATLGVIIGTMALFIVLSGFSGLKTFSLNFLNTSDPDIKITSVKGKTLLFTDEIQSKIAAETGIAHYTSVIEERVFLEFKGKTHLAYVKGVEDNFVKINSIHDKLVDGEWLNFESNNTAVIGNGVSNKLSLGINDFLEPLRIYVPKPGSGYVESVKNDISSIVVQPIGIFRISEELDHKFVFVPLELAQELINYAPNQISAIEIKVGNLDNRDDIISNLQKSLGKDYTIKTREQLNAVFYKMLNSEHVMAYGFSTLVLILFLINLTGTLIIIIYDKKENIKTLSGLGLDIKKIRKIFLLQGFLLTVLGLVVGLTLAIILVFLQKKFELFMITQSLAYPVEFLWSNVLVVFSTILVLGYIASRIASSRINKKIIE
jgi:lipoprotein-releasing system permease protein